MKKYLGIDIGGGSMKYGTYDEMGNSLDAGGSVPTVRDDLDKVLEAIYGIIDSYEALDGIGISVPGRIDTKQGIIYDGGAIRVLDKLPLHKLLSDKYNIPVAIENDANCATLAEGWIGAGRGIDHFICMTIGTGIGGGIVIDGKIYNGNHFYAGEFGYMYRSFDPSEGGVGICATDPLIQKANEDTDLTIANGKEFFENIDHPQIQEVYKFWINALSITIFNLASALDPAKVLLGGGVSAQNRIYDDIKKRIDEIAIYPYTWTVEPCALRNDAGKIGAVYKLVQDIQSK